MKNLRKNKKFVTGASAALTLLMLAAGTFAWFSAQDSVDNEFKTSGIPDGSVKVWEIFDEEEAEKATPGTAVQKDVGVSNLGESDVFVRASFEEMVHKFKNDGAAQPNLTVFKEAAKKADADLFANGGTFMPVPVTDTTSWTTAAAEGFTVTGVPAGVTVYVKEIAASATLSEYAVLAVSDQNGKVSADWTIDSTAKTITAANVTYDYYEKDTVQTFNWTAGPLFVGTGDIGRFESDNLITLQYHDANITATPTADKWYYNAADGWFYYVGIVPSGTVSPLLMTSVTLDKSAGNSYMYMDYTLQVKTEALQGTAEAIEAWPGATANAALKAALEAAATN